MKSIELILIILGLSVLCIAIASAALLFLPTPYTVLAVTFTGGIWTPVVSGLLIVWFNGQIKEGQLKTRIEFAAARQDILEVKNFVDGNYSKLLKQMEGLREDNQNQRDINTAQKTRSEKPSFDIIKE